MKDFDSDRIKREEADRSFQIGGEKFVHRASVAPEAILSWSEAARAGEQERARLTAAQMRLEAANKMDLEPREVAVFENKVADALEAVASTGTGEAEWIDLLDQTVVSIIEPDFAAAWHEVRSPEAKHPLNIEDLQALMEWLVGQVVSRPTGQASDSLPSGAHNGTSSTDDSLEPAAPASTVSTTEPEAVPVA